MLEIKTDKFIEDLLLSYQEFSLLLFGVVSNLDFVNRPINKNGRINLPTEWVKEILSLKDKPENPQRERCIKAKELIMDFKRREKNSDLPQQIASAVIKNTDAKSIEFDSTESSSIPDDLMELVDSNVISIDKVHYTMIKTYKFQFQDLFIFFTEEFETTSYLFANWVYPLLGFPVPDNKKSTNNSTIILNQVEQSKAEFIENHAPDEYVIINELPKLLQLAIKAHKHFDWENQDISSQKGRLNFNTSAKKYLSKTANDLKIPHSDPSKCSQLGISKATTKTFLMAIKPDIE
jgi:hypothetical protein